MGTRCEALVANAAVGVSTSDLSSGAGIALRASTAFPVIGSGYPQIAHGQPA